jgi:hypothetical protein
MMCLLGPADAHLGWSSRIVAAGLIITVTDAVKGKSSNAKQGARQPTGLGPVAHDGGRSFCATATSAELDGADLIRRC